VAAVVAAAKVAVEPTFFEVLTLVAFLYYAEKKVDVVAMEAGMGGRLDSTAVACGDIVVLTSIGLEHTEVLGPTESAILKEKISIVEAGDVITSPNSSHVIASPNSSHVIASPQGEAISSSTKTFIVGGLSEKLLAEAREYAASRGDSCIVPAIRDEITLPNLGRHYVENASLSLMAAETFINRSDRALYNDALALSRLKQCSWAGRMQQLVDSEGKVRYILDGAHNSHAVKRLVETLAEYYPGCKFHCVFGALKDKDVGEMLKLMAPFVSHWHITKTPYLRFRELADLREQLQNLGLSVASEGELSRGYLDRVSAANNEKLPVLVTGSLYMIGETVQALKKDYEGLAFFRGLEPTTNEHR